MTPIAAGLALLLARAHAEPADPPQVVRLEVATVRSFPGLTIEAQTTWLGEERSLTLRDDGHLPGDLPNDGLYVGEWEGEAVRTLPIRLQVSSQAHESFEAYGGLERVAQPRDRLTWALALDETPAARRVAAPLLARRMAARELSGVAASLGWTCLVFLYVAWLVGRERSKP